MVLLGRDPQLGRLVAIKVLRPAAMLDSEARQRFEREARLGSLLSHPAIVPIFETRSDGPIAYIAFEYCRGKSLADWLLSHERKIAPETAARIIAQLAQAVQYAHQRGVVHRDLKPSNILLDLDDHQATDESAVVSALRITDFGLSRSLFQSEDCLTRDGAIVGTPAYMAPEQASGKLESVGKSADIYSLGVILYQLLAGHPPFLEDTDLATLRAVESMPPPPLRRSRRAIPVDLEAICLKSLAKEPRNRYDSAYNLQCDLERYLAGSPVRARRATLLEKGWRWTRRNPAWTGAMSLLLVGLFATTWQWWRAEYHVEQANHFLSESHSHYARAERNLRRTEQAIDGMLNELADTLQHVPQMESLRTRLLQQALDLQQQLAAEQTDIPEVRFRTVVSQRRMGELLQALGKFDAARTVTESAISAISQLETHPAPFEWSCERGRLAGLMCELELSVDNARDALQFAIDAVHAWQYAYKLQPSSLLTGDYLLAQRRHGMVLEKLRNYQAAKAAFDDALRLADEIPTTERSEKTEILRGQVSNSLGVLYSRMGDIAKSESHYLKAIEIFMPIVEERPERVDLGYHLAITSFNMGNRHARQRAHDQAIIHYARAHEVLSKLVDRFPEHVSYRQDLFRVASGWGTSQFRLGDPHAAADLLEESLANQLLLPQAVRLSPNVIEDRALALVNFGSVCQGGLGDTDRALVQFQAALELRESLIQRFPDSIEILRGISVCKGNIAACSIKQEPAKALAGFVEAYELAEDVCNLDPRSSESQSNAAFQINQLVKTCWQQRDIDQALHWSNLYGQRANSANRRLAAARLVANCIQKTPSLASDASPASVDVIALPPISAIDEERLRTAAFNHLKLAVEQGDTLPKDLLLQVPFTALSDDARFADILGKRE